MKFDCGRPELSSVKVRLKIILDDRSLYQRELGNGYYYDKVTFIFMKKCFTVCTITVTTIIVK